MVEISKEARIAALETALADSIAYLKRLPAVPSTRELIASLEECLAQPQPAKARLQGARHSAAGVVIVAVEVRETTAMVRTGSPAEKAERLWEVLASGIAVPLAPAIS